MLEYIKNKKIAAHLLSLCLMTFFIFPLFAHAVVKFPPDFQQYCNTKGSEGQCTFNDFMELVQDSITYLFIATVPVVVIVVTYAGYLYMTASEGNVKEAKAMFGKVAWGFAAMCLAWLVVNFILTTLLNSDFVKVK